MFRIFRHYIPRSFLLLALCEGLIIWFSLVLGVELRLGAESYAELEPIWPKALAFMLVVMGGMTAVGLYKNNFRDGWQGVVLRAVLSMVIAVIAASFLFYAFPALTIGRGVFAVSFVLALLGIVCARLVFFHLVGKDALKRRVLVLGAGRRAEQFLQLRRKADRFGLNIIGYIHLPGEEDVVPKSMVLNLDVPLLDYAQRNGVHEIVVAMEDRRRTFPIDDLLDCRMSGIDVVDCQTFFERQLGRIQIDQLNPSWFVYSDGFCHGGWQVMGKRVFDIAASLLVLAFAWPLMVVAALGILIEERGRGPIFYRQVRVGQNWQLFQVLKFRSMRIDAEKDGVARWANKNDDRVTCVGKFIRRTRIDELPQLLNVLRGDMSFVGPRPERPEFVEQFAERIPYYAERHRVKPGITGWAQVRYPYGASEKDTIEKLQYDLYYVKNYSLFLDMLILLQTAEVVVWGEGVR